MNIKQNYKKILGTSIIINVIVICLSVMIVTSQLTTTYTITSGIYPHGVCTIWQEGATYFSKNMFGVTISSSTNGTLVYENIESTLTSGGTVFFAIGTYPEITVNQDNMTLRGDGHATRISGITVNSGIENLRVKDIAVNGYLVNEETTTLKDIIVEKASEEFNRVGFSGGSVIELSDGRLLATYTYSLGDSKWNSAYQKYSLDGGITWEQGFLLEANTSNYGVHGGRFLVSGSKIFWFHFHWWHAGQSELWYKLSTNNGETWGADTQVIAGAHPYMLFGGGAGIRLQNTRLVMPFLWGTVSPSLYWNCSTIYSSNDGNTWIESGQVPEIAGDSTTGTDEPSVCELSNGSLLMFIRTTGIGAEDKRIWQSLSDNSGNTWQTPKAVTQLFSYDTTHGLARLSWTPNIIMASWINRTSGGTWDRRPLMVAVSYNDGDTWEKQKVLDDLGEGVNSKNANQAVPLLLSSGEIWVGYWRYGEFRKGGTYYRDDAVSRVFNFAWLEVPQSSVQYLDFHGW